MGSRPKFDFYEKVVVTSLDPEKAEINGELGAVLGYAKNDCEKFGYAVHIYRDGVCWDLYEEELESTGEFDEREAFYDGSSIRVAVDPDGCGRIIG